jgi:MFS family permease
MKAIATRGEFYFSNVGHFLTHMFMLLYPTVVLALEQQFTLGYADLVRLALPSFLMFGLGALPAGWLADRWSDTGMLLVMFVGLGASSILTGLADSPAGLSVGLGLIGLFAAIYHPVGIAMVTRNPDTRGRDLGINSVFGAVGTAFAALVAGTLTGLISWRAAFIVPGVAAIVIGAGFALAMRRGRARAVKTAPRAEAPVSRRDMIVSFAALAFASSFVGIIYNATTIVLPKLFEQRIGGLGLGTISIGGMVSLVYLIAGASQLVGGWLADRYELWRLYLGAYLLQAPLLLLAAWLESAPLLIAAGAMVALQLGAVPVESSLYARYSPPKWRATSFGVKFIISLGVSGLVVPLVALIHERTGSFQWLFILLGALSLGVAVLALALPSERRGRTAAPTPAAAQAD